MTKRLAFVACAALLPLAGCGGAAPPIAEPEPVEPEGPSKLLEPTLISAELTTEVNDDGTPAAPADTNFGPEAPAIFLVAELDGLPEDCEIEAVWTSSARSKPLYTSTATGAGRHRLVSKLIPRGNMFEIGKYRVAIWLNRAEIGGVHFSVGEKASRFTTVKELNLSAWTEVVSKRPIDSKLSFRSGIKTVNVSFVVKGAQPGATIRVMWLRGENLLIEEDLEHEGTRRYALPFEQGKAIKDGEYAVEIEVDGEVLAKRTFQVGGKTVSSVVDHAALGVAKGKAKFPKGKKTTFKASTKGLRIGIGFFSLPDNAKVKVEWVALTEDGEQLLHTSEVTLEEGGKQAPVIDWTIEGQLAPGPHKAVIILGSRKMAELPFTIE